MYFIEINAGFIGENLNVSFEAINFVIHSSHFLRIAIDFTSVPINKVRQIIKTFINSSKTLVNIRKTFLHVFE